MEFSFPPANRSGTLKRDDRHAERGAMNITKEKRLEEVDPVLLSKGKGERGHP